MIKGFPIKGAETGVLLRVPLDVVDVIGEANCRKYSHADITSLAEALLAAGQQLQPVGFVRGTSPGRLRLVYGYRRYEALKQLAKQGRVPEGSPLNLIEGRILRGGAALGDLTDKDLFEVNVRENVNRLDLSPMEQAWVLNRLVSEFGYTLTGGCRLMGYSKSWGTQMLSLLKLPERVQSLIHAGGIGITAGYELSRLPPERLEAALSNLSGLDRGAPQSSVRGAIRRAVAGDEGDDGVPGGVMEGGRRGGEGEGESFPNTFEDLSRGSSDGSSRVKPPIAPAAGKPRTLRDLRAWILDWMEFIESHTPEHMDPVKHSACYGLLYALGSWLDGKGGYGANEKLRQAFITACQEKDEG